MPVAGVAAMIRAGSGTIALDSRTGVRFRFCTGTKLSPSFFRCCRQAGRKQSDVGLCKAAGRAPGALRCQDDSIWQHMQAVGPRGIMSAYLSDRTLAVTRFARLLANRSLSLAPALCRRELGACVAKPCCSL